MGREGQKWAHEFLSCLWTVVGFSIQVPVRSRSPVHPVSRDSVSSVPDQVSRTSVVFPDEVTAPVHLRHPSAGDPHGKGWCKGRGWQEERTLQDGVGRHVPTHIYGRGDSEEDLES